MAHKLHTNGKAPAVLKNSELDADVVRQARVDLAACFRMAARYGYHEGICNHFSFVVPGRDDLFLVNPYGMAFSEITASSLLVCDYDGNVVEGEGVPEATAFYIHGRMHMRNSRARAAFHTHMPNATALAMLEGEPFSWAIQTSLKFFGRTIVDEDYNGLALDNDEGDRIADSMGQNDVVFMKNHGVMVIGPSIAEAWDDLYYLERAAAAEVGAVDGPQDQTGAARHRAEDRGADARRRPRERLSAPGKHQAHPDARGTRVRDVSAPALLSDGPRKAPWTIALAHGAGAPMDSDWMNGVTEKLVGAGFRVVRFEFPYMAERRDTGKKKPPNPQRVLLETWRAVIGDLRPEKLIIGGKSMGGRMASLIADEAGVAGLVCMGYPFHPPGKPEKLRTEHLAALKTPTLICQGERDPFGTRGEVPDYHLSKKIKLHWAPDGDHGLKPRKASGHTEDGNLDAAVAAITAFAAKLA